jgi:hypothetical protein
LNVIFPGRPKQQICFWQRLLKSMGADLYIKNLMKKPDSPGAEHQNRSKIYFRDPYNLTSVLWTFGLSWWRDVLPLLDSDLELKGRALADFRDRIAGAHQWLPTAEELQQGGFQIEKEDENSIEALHAHFITKRKQLLQFLNRAIRNQSPVICSL